MIDLSMIGLALSAAAVLVGSTIQGLLGFGLVLTAGPVVALAEPRAIPATFLLLGIPIEVWMLARERHALDRCGFVQMMGGRLIGTLLAFGVLVAVSPDILSALIGVSIVFAAVLIGWRPTRTDASSTASWKVVAGVVSGLMGTVAAVGGPVMALVYEGRRAAELRATLAATFLAGGFLSLIAVWSSGLLDLTHLQLALWLLPAEIAGLMLSTRLLTRVEDHKLRAAVLGLAGLGGATIVLRAVI